MTDSGIFFKYDVEPLQISIWHSHTSLYRFVVRMLALVGGVLICTEWAYKGVDALAQQRERGGRGSFSGDGILNGLLEKQG
jgi:hypothetical protein